MAFAKSWLEIVARASRTCFCSCGRGVRGPVREASADPLSPPLCHSDNPASEGVGCSSVKIDLYDDLKFTLANPNQLQELFLQL